LNGPSGCDLFKKPDDGCCLNLETSEPHFGVVRRERERERESGKAGGMADAAEGERGHGKMPGDLR
jgi:hypothetical protein